VVWILLSLTNRYQYVEYNGVKSNLLELTCDVLQGSVLGPVLFLIYINDIINASKILQLILFEDDTNIFLSDANLDRLISTLNSELACMSKWFAINRLSLNVFKTNFILFCNSRKRYDKCEIKIMLNGIVLEQVKCAKFFGVYIHVDEYLSWDDHIQEVACKVSRNVEILRKLKFTLRQTCLLLLYSSLVLPYLHYCSIIWGCSSPNKLKSLIVYYKKGCRGLRIIAKAEFRAHTTPLFKKYSLLKIMDICQFQIAFFMFKFTISKLSSMFNSYFTYTKFHPSLFYT